MYHSLRGAACMQRLQHACVSTVTEGVAACTGRCTSEGPQGQTQVCSQQEGRTRPRGQQCYGGGWR